jgi:hypothetical protein
VNIARELAKFISTAFDPTSEDTTIDPPENFPTFNRTAGLLALGFEESPNPVLRAAARSIIEDLEL